MMKKHAGNIDHITGEAKGSAGALGKKIKDLRHENGIVKLHDDFEFKDSSKEVDLMHEEWQLEFEHYDEDDVFG